MQQGCWAAIGIVSVTLGGACWGQAALQPGCASTPAAAVEAARAGQAASSATGFRVESVRWDATQRQVWAVIRSCDHAERPTLAMLTDLPHGGLSLPPYSATVAISARIIQTNTASPVVHAGEVVRLWRADGQAHIELMATSEENGIVGGKVRLRLMTAKDPDSQYAPPKYFTGTVRGPADVEMEQ